jgi:hypothetical protein
MTSRHVAIIRVRHRTRPLLGRDAFASRTRRRPTSVSRRSEVPRTANESGKPSGRNHDHQPQGRGKARTQKRCYYGADGKVQKVAMGTRPRRPPAKGGGRGGGRVKGDCREQGRHQGLHGKGGRADSSYVPRLGANPEVKDARKSQSFRQIKAVESE